MTHHRLPQCQAKFATETFDVPRKIKLNGVHKIVQALEGRTDGHLYGLRAIGACSTENAGGVFGWNAPRSHHSSRARKLRTDAGMTLGQLDPEEAEIGHILDVFGRLTRKCGRHRRTDYPEQHTSPAEEIPETAPSGTVMLKMVQRWYRLCTSEIPLKSYAYG